MTEMASQTPSSVGRMELSVGQVVSAFRRHIWLALSVLLLVLAAAAAFGVSRTKIYRATATLQIDPKPPTPLGQGVEGVVDLGTGTYWANVEYYNTQHALIHSLPVATSAVRELGLHHDPSFFSNTVEMPENSRTEGMKTEEAIQLAARTLKKRLTVSPKKESRLVHVSFDDAKPERASRVLDAVIRSYITHNVEKSVESTSSAVDWLDEQLEKLRGELAESELALHEYKLEKQIASVGIDDQTGILKREIAQLSERRTTLRAKIQAATARLQQLTKIKLSEPESIPQMELLESEVLADLRADYMASIQEKRALMGSGKGERHPDVLAVSERANATKRALGAEIQNIKDGARQELEALRQEESGIHQLLEQAEQKALELNLMEIEYNRLRRTKDNNEKLYGLVLERSKEAGLTQMLKVNNIQVLSPATTARTPVEPKMGLILAAGALAGLFFGLTTALAREQLDRSVKSLDELESRLGLTPLGAIPQVTPPSTAGPPGRRRKRRARNVAPELLVHAEPKSSYAESVRGIRTNLLFMSPDHPFQRVLVTSAAPAEGKTTVACSLAITMAHAGHKVLLVDCDMRKPRLHIVFPEKEPRSTLSESLLNLSQFNPNSLSTEIAGLSILPAGPCPPNPTELLHSDIFQELLRRLDHSFDLLILDSPPLLVSDAAILSTRVDGAVLVARAGKSHINIVARAVRSVKAVGGNVIGGIMNAAPQRRGGYGYGYEYGYGHGYGYGQAN